MPTDKVIAVLGLKASGKSTFLAVLNLALALQPSPWRIRPVGSTIKLMSTYMNFIFNRGEYPPQTTVETDMEFFVEKGASMLGFIPGAQFRMHAADVPGEAVKGVGSDISLYHEFYEKHLKGCSGIIFLVDYKEQWREGARDEHNSADVYFTLFSSILAEIREQVGIYPYTAFCITKVDQVVNQGPHSRFDREGYFDGVEELAEQIIGRNTKALIDHTFDNDHLCWFPVSATGFTGEGNKRTAQFVEKMDTKGDKISGIRNPKDLKPIGVAESLEWVLDKLAEDDEDARIIKSRGKPYAEAVKGIRKFLGFG